jgi:hypothetical protein
MRRTIAAAFAAAYLTAGGAVFSAGAAGRILEVGPGRNLTQPSEAARLARPGDTVRIDSGDYRDCAVWRTPDITIEGAGGYAHVRDVSCEGKGIWVFYAAPVTIRHVRFSGAAVPRRNGAGIRWEGGGLLVVENGWFDGNQMGLLAHNRRSTSLVVRESRFENNGACETFCGHGLYAGLIAELTVEKSVFAGQRFGHHIKSRAATNLIAGNRIEDGPEGTASYAVDLPNGGAATIRGNSIEKGPHSDNPYCAICIGEEIRPEGEAIHPAHRANPPGTVVIEDNRFESRTGSTDTAFVWNRGPHPVVLRGNALSGAPIRYVAGPRPELERKKETQKGAD